MIVLSSVLVLLVQIDGCNNVRHCQIGDGPISTSFNKFLRVDNDLAVPRVTICELHAII